MGKTKWYARPIRRCELKLRAKRRGSVAILLALALVVSFSLVTAVATPVAANPDGITVTLDVSFEGDLTEACKDTGMDLGWALASDMDYYDGYGGDPAYPNPPMVDEFNNHGTYELYTAAGHYSFSEPPLTLTGLDVGDYFEIDAYLHAHSTADDYYCGPVSVTVSGTIEMTVSASGAAIEPIFGDYDPGIDDLTFFYSYVGDPYISDWWDETGDISKPGASVHQDSNVGDCSTSDDWSKPFDNSDQFSMEVYTTATPPSQYVDAAARIRVRYKIVPIEVWVDDGFDSSTPGWGETHFATIQDGINAVAESGTVNVAAGGYDENVDITKHITLQGAGSGNDPVADTIIASAAANVPVINITASGASAEDRLTVRDLRVTGASGSGHGILVDSSSNTVEHLSFDRVAAVNNGTEITGVGSNFFFNYQTNDMGDVIIDTPYIDNGFTGVQLDGSGGAKFDGLKILGGQINNNRAGGFLSGEPDSLDATNIEIDGTQFNNNGSNVGNFGNIIFQIFEGNATVKNVDINTALPTAYAIQFRGNNGETSGNIILDNVKVMGTNSKVSLLIQEYADVSGFSLHNVDVSGATGDWGTVAIGHSDPSGFDLGTTTLPNLVLWYTGNVDATQATFVGTTTNFEIEDKVYHALDLSGLGLVTWVLGNLYVTQDSGSIQRAIDSATEGDTINVAAGTYHEGLAINKSLTLEGKNRDTTVIDGTGVLFGVETHYDYGILITAQSGVKICNFTIQNFRIDDPRGGNPTGLFFKLAGTQMEVSNVTIKNNLGTGMRIWHISGSNFSDIVLENNNNEAAAVWLNKGVGLWLSYSSNNVFTNIAINGHLGCGIFNGEQSNGNSFTNIGCNGNKIGIYFSDSSTNTVAESVIKNNEKGIFLWTSELPGYECDNNEIHLSNIVDNGVYGINNYNAGVVDATNNWWGDASGPSGVGPGTGDAVSANVDFFPWALDEGFTKFTNDATDVIVVDDGWATLPDYTQVIVDSTDYYIGANAFATIQAGIDAVAEGGTINVAPGIYNPASTIVINKDSLVLQGPQAGVDPRPSYDSTRIAGSPSEAIIDGGPNNLGMIIEVDADNVVINGLEVKSGTGDMIKQNSAHIGTTVKYCIIHDGRGDEGVQLKKCTEGVLEYNYVYDIASPGDALNISDDSTNGKIRYNEVYNIGSENAAIYVYGSTNMDIVGNLVHHVTQNDGIKLGDKNGDDANRTGGLIKDNVVYDTEQDGISVYMSGVTVEGNEVYNSRSENGAIYLAWAINNIDIHGNSVHDNVLNPSAKTHVGGIGIESPVDAANVHINNNNIYNNTPYGVNNDASAAVDATNNWWGDASGPTHTSNLSGTGDAVSANVDFFPWALNEGCTEFTNTDTTVVVVDDDWTAYADYTQVFVDSIDYYIGVNAFATIQDGIDAVAEDGTVNVAAGTYNETVKLKSTTASGISVIGENKATTFITGGICFDASYSGLKVQNFTIKGNGFLDTETYEATVSCSWTAGHVPVTNLEFSDCIFDGEGYDDGRGGRCGIVLKKLGGVVKFENNEFKNYRGWATLDVNDQGETVTSYTFNDNNVHDNWGSCALRGNPSDRTDTVTVTGNTFNNNGNLVADSWAALEINEADSVTVSNNTITNTQAGSWGEGEALQFWHITTLNVTGNTIANNYEGIYFPGGAWASDISGVHINFNNIYGNTQFGFKAEDDNTGTVDATNNWWGDVSGPSGVGYGTGDAVSDNVNYDPWLDAPAPDGKSISFVDVKQEPITNDTLDAKSESDTEVVVDGTATVTAAKYSHNPGSGFDGDISKYIDVHIGDDTNVTQLEIRLYYTDAEIAGLVESSLRLRWWNGTDWVACSPDSGVNTTDIDGYSGYMWARITATSTPSLSDLVGAPFGGGGVPPTPDISVDPASINFGNVTEGTSSSLQTVTVSNDGTANLVVGTIIKGGTNPGQFSITEDSCSGATIAPEGSATLKVVFSPTSTGAKSATLSIPSNDPDETTVTVPLGGTGVSAPPPPPTYYTLTVTCDPIEGGTVSPPGGDYPAGTTVELTATPNADYAFGSWSDDLTGSTNPDTITMNSDKEVTANFMLFSAPANVEVTAADPGVDSIDVSTIDLSEVDTTNMPEIVEAQEAYVVDSTGTGSFTLRFTDIANASNIVVYKVVDSTWTEIPITAITVIDPTTVEVTMEVGDPILVFGLPTGVPPEPWDPWSYDENGDGKIQKSEAINAVEDYFDGVITKEQAIEVVSLYFEYVWDPWSYDENGDGEIQKSEAISAVVDYFDGVITKEQAIEVVLLYFG